MYRPYPGTSRTPPNSAPGRPGAGGRRAGERAGRGRPPVLMIPVTCERAELAVPVPARAGGWLADLHLAAASAARPAAPIVPERAQPGERIAGCAGTEAVAAGYPLPGQAR